MNLSGFDLGRVTALHLLLEEAHVGRAAGRLGITPAAASNALRRLREDFRDPLLVQRGRGVVRTRVGEALREPARAVIAAAEALLAASRPFDPSTFAGPLAIALAEHVAASLLPELDRLARERAPHAQLAIAPIPDDPAAWLERTRGVLVGPMGPFAAATEADGLTSEPLYRDRYVVACRAAHPASGRRWNAATYAGLEHVLVLPRGRTARSGIDERLAAKGLSRRVVRIVPSFTLALELVKRSDAITTMPEFYARHARLDAIVLRELPFRSPMLDMAAIVHPAHERDEAIRFVKDLLRAALAAGRPDTPDIPAPAVTMRYG
ncbi:MAG: LysR family transcriptional regulator [Methylobacteriaceae bacterium]|nr:LysR family transcriptional regulator [Methylobacteriaceae bacterium]